MLCTCIQANIHIKQITQTNQKLKTNFKMAMDGSDKSIASLITDGCNMGVKSLHMYMNQYTGVDNASKDICSRLISIEDKLCKDMQPYL